MIFSDWYLPGYRAGGPIRSLANLVTVLKYDFYIATRNTDHNSNTPYKNIQPNSWIKTADNVHVIYLEESNLSTETFARILNERKFDKIYFNSLFSPRFTLLPLRAARKMGLEEKCVLAPRGMLKPGALSIKSRKKKIFLFLAKITGLYNGIIWHATSADEKEVIRKHFPGASEIRIAPNLSDVPVEKPTKSFKQTGELKLICIARISPEKGIKEALRFLEQTNSTGTISCDFFGTHQNTTYLQECQDIAETIKHVKIRFKGEILPSTIPEVLKDYHFFFMPTLGENFGHAISEALTHATPVIISDLTPWRGLENKRAGWDLPLEEKFFVKVLERCCKMNNAEYTEWSDGAYLHGSQVALDHTSIEASYKVFD